MNTIELPISRGYVAKIDDIDADLAKVKWFALCEKHNYVVRRNKERRIYLHRVVMARIVGRELVKSDIVDHINGDRLDNRRSNLRLVTPSQSSQNTSKSYSNRSGYKGVTFNKKARKYLAKICVDRKHIYLGLFETPEQAHAAYCEASKKYHGEYGRTE